jgi:ubiquinone/menaquinone biosynthesis C-methylase UbiE
MQTHLYDTRDVHLRYAEARRLPRQTMRMWMDRVAKYAPPRMTRIVDLGCGTGRFSDALAMRFKANVTAIDCSAKMLASARAACSIPSTRFVRAAAEAIPLADASVDLVFMSMVYHHLVDRAATFHEVRRVLAPGGRCIVRTCSLENLDSYLYQRFFPGARRIDLARLESRDLTVARIASCGLNPIARACIQQISADSLDLYIQKVSARGTSDLEAISDADFERGLASLREWAAAQANDGPIREHLDLLVFAAQLA